MHTRYFLFVAFHCKSRAPIDSQLYRIYWCNAEETQNTEFEQSLPQEDDYRNQAETFNRDLFVDCAKFLRQLSPYVRGNNLEHTGEFHNLMANYVIQLIMFLMCAPMF